MRCGQMKWTIDCNFFNNLFNLGGSYGALRHLATPFPWALMGFILHPNSETKAVSLALTSFKVGSRMNVSCQCLTMSIDITCRNLRWYPWRDRLPSFMLWRHLLDGGCLVSIGRFTINHPGPWRTFGNHLERQCGCELYPRWRHVFRRLHRCHSTGKNCQLTMSLSSTDNHSRLSFLVDSGWPRHSYWRQTVSIWADWASLIGRAKWAAFRIGRNTLTLCSWSFAEESHGRLVYQNERHFSVYLKHPHYS